MNVLIADSSMPFAATLAGFLRAQSMSVALLSPVGGEVAPVPLPEGISSITWNRSSRLSARTIQVAVKNSFASLDCAVIMFDIRALSGSGQESADPPSVIDGLVSGSLLLVHEIEDLFLKQGHGRIVFVQREVLADSEVPGSGPAKNLTVAVAESAFVRLAEETAASAVSGMYPGLQVSLVKIGVETTQEISVWFDSFLKTPAGTRGPLRWVRAGSRGLFGKF